MPWHRVRSHRSLFGHCSQYEGWQLQHMLYGYSSWRGSILRSLFSSFLLQGWLRECAEPCLVRFQRWKSTSKLLAQNPLIIARAVYWWMDGYKERSKRSIATSMPSLPSGIQQHHLWLPWCCICSQICWSSVQLKSNTYSRIIQIYARATTQTVCIHDATIPCATFGTSAAN